MNYLIYGSSFNLIDEEIKKIIKDESPNIYFLDETPIDEIIEDISYDSMFQEKKVIILKNFETMNGKKESEKSLKILENYLDNPSELSTLIFISNEKIPSKGSLKNIISKLKVIETPIITKSSELSNLLGALMKKEGYAISMNVLNNFCEKCNLNYDIALNEFKKLKMSKGSNHLITDNDVLEYVSNYNTTDVFGLKDAIINRNIPKALSMLDDLETAKMELIPLVVMLAKEYQIVLNIKILSDRKMTNEQIGVELGNMHPYRVKILKEVSFKYKESELENLILELANMDRRLVSEDNLGFDELRKFLLLL